MAKVLSLTDIMSTTLQDVNTVLNGIWTQQTDRTDLDWCYKATLEVLDNMENVKHFDGYTELKTGLESVIDNMEFVEKVTGSKDKSIDLEIKLSLLQC